MSTIRLNANNLPPEFSSIIGWAEKWGVGDDVDREMAIENATTEELNTLSHCLDNIDDYQLVEWLNGDETKKKPLSEEYVAVTCLTMAVQSAKSVLKRRNL